MPNLQKDRTLLSRFSLLEMIGEGGMGQVWRVWDLELETPVALKILNPKLTADPEKVKLLKNECRNTRRLAHPNIVRVFDFHRSDDVAFISMEYIEGQNLTSYRDQNALITPAAACALIKPVVNALGYAHELGLIHRDVKCANILLDRQKKPRLSDFGIASVFKTGSDALRITSGGSLFCMSPQQLDGHPPHPSDDIYALGVLLYELLTGYPPFYPDITRQKILHEIPTPVHRRLDPLAVTAHISQPLQNMISSMLAKEPQDRPASMQTIEDSLDHVISARVDQPPMPDEPKPGPAKTDSDAANDHLQIITPVSVTRGIPGRELPLTGRSSLIKGVTLAIAFVLLVTGGLWLWHYLADRPPESSPMEIPAGEQAPAQTEKSAEIPEALPETTADPVALAAEKEEAEKNLAEFMRLKQELETKGASRWGGETYQEMTRLAGEADRFLIENNYVAASDKYREAAAGAQLLTDQVEPSLNRLLSEGQAAIEGGNSELARQKFSTALMIDADNRSARQGLQRAQNLDAVMRLLESGNRHENEGRIAFAHADFQKAAQLDPASTEAQKALARVKEKIKASEFQELMSEGLTALHQDNFELARARLLKAKSFRPQSKEVEDALAQVDQSIRLARIETYRREAASAEQAENWQKAADAYSQALKIDPNIQFAAQGKQRASNHIRIERRINFFLQKPAALESDRQLENANALIAEIEEMNPRGPRLQRQFEQLTQLVIAAQTPVKIVLESDTFTDIAVYKVGKLGRFESRELSLRPGTYTVVGTRSGYQDVRKKIIIKPGQGPTRIPIKCEIKI